MKNTSHNPYDLTIANVQKWRNDGVNKFTAKRTRLWFEMRDRGQQQERNGWVGNFQIYDLFCTWSRYFFWTLVFAGGICLAFSLSSFIATIISGRLDQILGGH
jgi:hypothetical protein